MQDLIPLIPWLHIYISVGFVLLIILVVLVGIRGSEWTPKNLLIVFTWPLDLANLLGTMIGFIISTRPGAKPITKEQTTQESIPLRDLND